MTRAFSIAALLVALMGAAVQGAETFGAAPTLAEVTPLTAVIPPNRPHSKICDTSLNAAEQSLFSYIELA